MQKTVFVVDDSDANLTKAKQALDGNYDEDDEEDYEPPVMIVTRLPRLLGVNVQK